MEESAPDRAGEDGVVVTPGAPAPTPNRTGAAPDQSFRATPRRATVAAPDHAADAAPDHAADAASAEVLEPGDFDTMRVGYGLHDRLDVADLAAGWLPLFTDWLDEAGRRGVREPNAMVLGTVEGGRPSTRTVLCKGADDLGVTFFTTTTSRKGAQLAASGFASVTFPWLVAERQVHMEGPCHPLSREDSLAYWRTRPRGSQVAAWASEQSRPVSSVAQLEALYTEAQERFAGDEEVPMPDRWGGYRLSPERVEVWQGGRDRFHDRVECRLQGGRWVVSRLQP